MRKIITIFILFMLVFSLSACGTNNGTNHDVSNGDGIMTLDVGTWKTPQTITPFFYQNQIADNLNVNVVPFTNPGDMKTALMAGSLDLCGTTIVTAITAASKDEPVKIVAGLSNKCSALVVGTDSDIETGADLKGKKIAYVPGTMHHLLLLEVLNKHGLDPEKDVELMRIDFFDMGQALAQGTVDAFYSGEPYPSIAVKEGYGKILLYPDDNEGFGIINSAVMTSQDKIDNNREIIQNLVTAHAQATEFLINNRQDWLDKSEEFGTARDVLEVAADNIEFFWEFDDHYMKSVENLAQRMLEQGLITKIPDIEAMFDLSFMEQAKRK
ncbi:MAG: ABC transporter substrate-binding protein [Dehalobacterium sp.]